MIEIPAPVKVLKYFFDNKKKRVTEQEVVITIGESKDRIGKALQKLSEKGLLKMERGFYFYVETPRSDDLAQKMLRLYEHVKKPPREQILRDLVSEMFLKPDELEIRLLEEGFSQEEIEAIMEQEVDKLINRRTQDYLYRVRS